VRQVSCAVTLLMFHTSTPLTQIPSPPSDRGAVCRATGPVALPGVPAFAVARSLSVPPAEEQQNRRGQL